MNLIEDINNQMPWSIGHKSRVHTVSNPVADIKEPGRGIRVVGIAANAKTVLEILDLLSDDPKGAVTVQCTVACSLKLTTSGTTAIRSDAAYVAANGGLPGTPACTWDDLAVGALDIVEIPATTTGIYFTAAAAAVLTVRRT